MMAEDVDPKEFEQFDEEVLLMVHVAWQIIVQ
jgi:hypothetical protein